MFKVCASCNENLPIEEFAKIQSKKQGSYGNRCKPCYRLISRKKYERNSESCKERSKRYLRNHPEYNAVKNSRRRVLINKNESSLTEKQWIDILNIYDRKCVYCNSVERITMDHLLPLSKNGDHVKTNVIPACLSCNSRKGNNIMNVQLKLSMRVA